MKYKAASRPSKGNHAIKHKAASRPLNYQSSSRPIHKAATRPMKYEAANRSINHKAASRPIKYKAASRRMCSLWRAVGLQKRAKPRMTGITGITRGLHGDYRGLPGITGDYRGLPRNPRVIPA